MFTRSIKQAIAAAFVIGAGYGAVANAAPAIGFDPTGTGTYSYYADTLTNDTDSALALGFNPFAVVGFPGATHAPYDTQLIAQTNVNALTLNGVQQLAIGPASGFEITKVTSFSERVTLQLGSTFVAWTQPGAVQPDIDGATAGSQQLMIFFDPTPDSNPNTSGGYTDGILILSARIADVLSSFAVNPLNPTVGTGAFRIDYIIDYVNANYLDLVSGSILTDVLQGNSNIPALYNPPTMWDGTPSAQGIIMRIDSSENFLVPEPGTLALVGLALLGAGALNRKRS